MRTRKKSKKGGQQKFKLTIELGEGLGNRIFKILAGLEFANKWDMDFCLVKSHILNNDHISLEESINDIKILFPNIEIYDNNIEFPIEYREKEQYVYEDFPKPNNNTILYGLFQSEKNFPKNVNINIPIPNNNILANKDNLYFIQFRLDDYLNYSETNLDLRNYYKKCINELKKSNEKIKFIILSKNIDDAKKYINEILNDVLDINTLIFDPNTSRIDSLYYMSQCKGGIIPNSTFAWIGAYLSQKKKVFFPYPWMNSFIKEKQYDIYPSWATMVDINTISGGANSNEKEIAYINLATHTETEYIYPIIKNIFPNKKIVFENGRDSYDLLVKSTFDDTNITIPFIYISGEPYNQTKLPDENNKYCLARLVTSLDTRLYNDITYYLPFFLDVGPTIYNISPFIREYNPNDKRKYLAAYINRNTYPHRDNFFKILSQLDTTVHALANSSKSFNVKLPDAWWDLPDIYKDYIFGFAMENTNEEGYITEKIMNVYRGGAIPIYWGTSKVKEIFNPESFIYVNDYPDFESCAKDIVTISKNPERLLKMQNAPIFNVNNPIDYSKYYDTPSPQWVIDIANNILSRINNIIIGGSKSMKAYVINLDKRPEKWERIQNEFKDTDIDVERFSAITHENGHIGCGLSHVALVKMAKEKNMDSILIIEDDCKITKNFNKRWATIKKYLDEHKDEWDIFNGGVVWPANATTIVKLEPDINLIRSNGPGCRYAHFVYVNKSAYDKVIEWESMVLDAIKDNKEFIDPKYDSWINEYPRFRNLLLNEAAIAVQYSGRSNTNDINKDISRWGDEQEAMIQDGGDDCNINYFTVSTMYTAEMKRLERNAEKYGWKLNILGLEQNRKDLGWEDQNKEKGTYGQNFGDFSLKLNGLNEFIKDKKDDDIVLWTDAWDVVVLDTCNNMYEKYKKFNKPIVFSAEKACSPDGSKKDLYDTLDTKFPFLCAGMFIGRVDKLKYLMTFYKGEKINDQVFWTDMYLKNKDLIALDNNAEIFLSTWNTDGKYYEFKDNKFTYTETNTNPVFIHANGNIKDKLKLFEDYFNLTIYTGYVVNLEERTSKWNQIQDDFKDTNFFLERFNAIKDENGHKGCGKSYQALIKMAKEKNMDSIFIFDDDCKPLDNFNERWIKVKKWLDNNNDKWEIFNGGLKVVHGAETQLIDTIDESNKIYSIHKGIYTQMVLYKKETYDRILEWDYDKNWLIDFNYINTNKFKTIYIEPALTVQRDGFSNTEKINKEHQLGGKKKSMKLKRYKRKTIKKKKNKDNKNLIGGNQDPIHYITVSTKDTPELQRLIKSAKKYGWNLEVLGLDLDTTNLGHSKGGKFGMKLRYPKEYLKDKNDNDIVLFSDAWDVMVLGKPEELLNKYKSFNKDIVISAENACWPDGSREPEYSDTKNEPFPYLNSGGYVGKVSTLKQIFNNYNDDDIDDQRFWTDMYFKNRDKIVLDTKAEIFLSMHDVKQEDFQFDNEKFTYKETNTNPILVHGNGTSKGLLDIFTNNIKIGGNKNMLIMILEHGLGNRFFQIMAGYGFAEKWNMDLYFKNVGNNHISDAESNKEILQLFPNMKFLDDSVDISKFKRMGEITDTNDISDENPNENYVMSGLFHKTKYFPTTEIKPVLVEPANNIIKDIDTSNLFFIHLRFGDYEKDRPMQSLIQYFKKCISLINKDFINSKYLIISDEIDKAKLFVANNLESMLQNKIIYDTGNNRLDSLYYMSKCRGGIISNSTYSWFGAYCIENKNGYIYMPEPYLDNDRYFDNIYPTWATKISRYSEGGRRKNKTKKRKYIL